MRHRLMICLVFTLVSMSVTGCPPVKLQTRDTETSLPPTSTMKASTLLSLPTEVVPTLTVETTATASSTPLSTTQVGPAQADTPILETKPSLTTTDNISATTNSRVRIVVTGIGIAPDAALNPTRREQSALRAALLVADRNFAQWKEGAELEAVTIVEQGALTTDTIREVVRTRVFGGTMIEQVYDDATGTAQITVEYVVSVSE